MRRRPGPSRPGSPPHHHIKPGLKAILYDIQGNEGIIGPRKFKNSRFFNRPVPNIHEFGGIAMGTSFTGSRLATYPERSFMYSAVQNLQRKGKINPAFSITFRRYF